MSDSSVVFRPACVITAAARFSSSSCGAYPTTIGSPLNLPSLTGSMPPPSEITSCASIPEHASAIVRNISSDPFCNVPMEA